MRPNATATHHFAADPRAYFDPGPSLTYRTNSHGFRSREVPLAKPPGVARVLGLCDSFTFGRGVRRQDTFLAVLEQSLLEAGRAVAVLNLGVTGYDTADEVGLLRGVGLDYAPDLVVICFFLNDVTGTPASRYLSVRPGGKLPGWRRASQLADHLAARVERYLQGRRLVAEYRGAILNDTPGWRRAKQALAEAAELSRRENFELVLMLFPVLHELSGPSPFVEAHARIATFAEGVGIRVLDLLPEFAGHEGPELWVHPGNQHANADAHRIAGEALSRFLEENALP